MDPEEKKQKAEELAKAVELYEDLHIMADGGQIRGSLNNEFAASTLLLLIDDKNYRKQVQKAHEKAYG